MFLYYTVSFVLVFTESVAHSLLLGSSGVEMVCLQSAGASETAPPCAN